MWAYNAMILKVGGGGTGTGDIMRWENTFEEKKLHGNVLLGGGGR